MIKTNLVKVAALTAVALLNNGCNAGNTTNPSISAAVTSYSCLNMISGNTCVITLTYNTNGVSGMLLGYNSTPSPLQVNYTTGTFDVSYGQCQNQVESTTGQSTCPITITYISAGGSGTTATINFTLGNATANTISLSGD